MWLLAHDSPCLIDDISVAGALVVLYVTVCSRLTQQLAGLARVQEVRPESTDGVLPQVYGDLAEAGAKEEDAVDLEQPSEEGAEDGAPWVAWSGGLQKPYRVHAQELWQRLECWRGKQTKSTVQEKSTDKYVMDVLSVSLSYKTKDELLMMWKKYVKKEKQAPGGNFHYESWQEWLELQEGIRK